MGAGGLWMPFHCDDKRTSRWALETLDELMTEVDKDDPLVEIVHTVQLKRKHEGPSVGDYVSSISSEAARQREGGDLPLPEWTKDPRLDFQHMTAEMLSWQNIVFKLRLPSESQLKRLGYLHAWHFKPPIVDSPRMLEVSFQPYMFLL
jgi:D-amino-acid oxidase